MQRVEAAELLENPLLSEDVVAQVYSDLARTQRLLGNTRAIFRALRKNRQPISRVLDIGCGQGSLLEQIQKKFRIEVVGFDLRPVPHAPVRIITGNAATDPLPAADVAFSVCLVHHLSEADVIKLIQNASKSCRRLVLLDLVRHWIPLVLFKTFMTPFLHPINASDGITSIKRAYTPGELRSLVDEAVQSSGARVVHTVSPFYVRQIVDIEFKVI